MDEIKLTARQEEALTLLAQGLTPASAAKRMNICVRTLNYHVQCAFRALGVENLFQAVLLCMQHRCVLCGRILSPYSKLIPSQFGGDVAAGQNPDLAESGREG